MLEFGGRISWGLQEMAPRGHILIKPDDTYYEYIKGKLKPLIGKPGKSANMQFKFSSLDDSKTSKQTAFIWVLYDLMAKILNGGMKGPGMIKSKQLYLDDIRRYSESEKRDLDKDFIQFLKHDYYIFDDETQALENGLFRVTVYRRLSKFTKKEANVFIDIILQELSQLDIPIELQPKVLGKVKEYQLKINSQKYIRFEDQKNMTQAQYKNLTKYCEMCFGGFGSGSGDLHHINPRGMGGNQEAWKEQPSNWLHLHRLCHNKIEDSAVTDIITEYPHLEYKIKNAQKLGKKENHVNQS